MIYHNTFWTTAPNVNDADLITPVSNVKMRDNIFQSAGYSIYQVPRGALGIDADYNNWYSSLEGPHFMWEKVNYYVFSALCTRGGLECHGYDDLPGLSNPTGGDFSLSASSLNIDRGIPIPGINDGFIGDAPDLGVPNQLANALTFRTHYHRQPAIQPDLIGCLGFLVFIQPHHPRASFFKRFYGLYQIGADNKQVFRGP